jgi:hypothetical protein
MRQLICAMTITRASVTVGPVSRVIVPGLEISEQNKKAGIPAQTDAGQAVPALMKPHGAMPMPMA